MIKISTKRGKAAVAATLVTAAVAPAVALASSTLYYDGVIYSLNDGDNGRYWNVDILLTYSHGKSQAHSGWSPQVRTTCVSALYRASLNQAEPVSCSDNTNGFSKSFVSYANNNQMLKPFGRATTSAAVDTKLRGEYN